MKPEAIDLATAWQTLTEHGWGGRDLSAVYPMPGDQAFDSQLQFLALPIFPHADSGVTHAYEATWEFPLAWAPHFATRPRGDRLFRFDRQMSDGSMLGDCPGISEYMLTWRRATYIDLFGEVNASAISSIKKRHHVCGVFIKAAVETGVPLEEFLAEDILAVVEGLNVVNRSQVGRLFANFQWWCTKSPGTYGFFGLQEQLPDGQDEEAHSGLDTARIREEQPPSEPHEYHPLPDEFVAALGEKSLRLIEAVRPILNLCCIAVKAVSSDCCSATYNKRTASVIRGFEWPDGFQPRNRRELTSLAYDCQTATMMMTSLMLGSRSSEVLGLEVTAAADGTENQYIISGNTFKFSQSFGGDERDWPLHPIIGKALVAQAEYVKIMEGEEFFWLWKSHERFFGSGQPVKHIPTQLEDFVDRHKLRGLLGGSSFHHHRIRKTVARLIVKALLGGPLILRRLFGHQRLGPTIRYMLSDPTFVRELQEAAIDEQSTITADFIEHRDDMLGKGAEVVRDVVACIENSFKVIVPRGKKEQRKVGTAQILEMLSNEPDGLVIKQIVPGLIGCTKPPAEAGACCSQNELPNVSECDADCRWHIMMSAFENQAVENVSDALKHIAADHENPLIFRHFSSVVIKWARRFESVRTKFEGNSFYDRIMNAGDAEVC